MEIKFISIPQILLNEISDREIQLWQLLREQQERIRELEDEIARLKGEKGKPKIKPSRLEPSKKSSSQEEEDHRNGATEKKDKKKRAGSAKRHKTKNLEIHETKIIQPITSPPPDSE